MRVHAHIAWIADSVWDGQAQEFRDNVESRDAHVLAL